MVSIMELHLRVILFFFMKEYLSAKQPSGKMSNLPIVRRYMNVEGFGQIP